MPTPLNRRALIVGAVTTAVLFEFGKWARRVPRSQLGRQHLWRGRLAGLDPDLGLYVSLIMLYGAELTFQLNRIARVTARPPRPMPSGRRRAHRPGRAGAPAGPPGMPLPADADETLPARVAHRWLVAHPAAPLRVSAGATARPVSPYLPLRVTAPAGELMMAFIPTAQRTQPCHNSSDTTSTRPHRPA